MVSTRAVTPAASSTPALSFSFSDTRRHPRARSCLPVLILWKPRKESREAGCWSRRWSRWQRKQKAAQDIPSEVPRAYRPFFRRLRKHGSRFAVLRKIVGTSHGSSMLRSGGPKRRIAGAMDEDRRMGPRHVTPDQHECDKATNRATSTSFKVDGSRVASIAARQPLLWRTGLSEFLDL